jgi:hypothetical protein
LKKDYGSPRSSSNSHRQHGRDAHVTMRVAEG